MKLCIRKHMEHRRQMVRKSMAWSARIAALPTIFFCCWLVAIEVGALCLRPGGQGPSTAAKGHAALYQSQRVAVYVVKKGDRLTDLARRFYGDPGKAWMIQDANELEVLEPGQILTIPLRPINRGGLSADGYQMVPVLAYHHFSSNCASTLCMPIDEFSRQMSFLKRGGYRTITMGELLKFITYEEPLPRRAVAITIDDGYRSAYDLAYPILKEHNFRATLFIYTDFIENSPNALTWAQLREMTRAGFEVEAHTMSHADLTRKHKGESEFVYWKRIRRELRVPRELIRKHLAKEAIWLAYPYGRTNDLVIRLAYEMGYRGAVTVIRGTNSVFVDPFRVKRYRIVNPSSDLSFRQMLKVFYKEKLQ